MAKAYGKTDLVHSGPIFREAKPEGGALRVSFDHTGGGLITADGKAPSHLEIAGADGTFVVATGTIEGNSLIVRSDAVPAPVTVRYAWHEEAMPNLKNREGLPAAPFHSEKWPLKQP
jgi:sialate O-acetylesterase